MPDTLAFHSVLIHLLGGIGLFLLGMSMLTEGLKLAAGSTLERILTLWTQTRLRGLLTGFVMTALVQSSSAMTVAAIGFVNAGLLSFQSSLWVVFGSNVGSTVTGWPPSRSHSPPSQAACFPWRQALAWSLVRILAPLLPALWRP